MLDTQLITYLAKLSKLELSDDAKERLASEMSEIVNLMDSMNEVQMEGQVNLNGEGMSLSELREDEVIASYNEELLLKNAAHRKDGFFVVPKIME